MKTEDGSESLHPWIEPELEARLTALVLGEASDFERDELERLVAERPELALYRKRLEAMHRLLREVADGESGEDQGEWRLSAERRAALLAKLGAAPARQVTTVAGAGARRRMSWGLALRIAACIAVVAFVLALMMPRHEMMLSSAGVDRDGSQYLYAEAAKSASVEADGFFFGTVSPAESNQNSEVRMSTTGSTAGVEVAATPLALGVPESDFRALDAKALAEKTPSVPLRAVELDVLSKEKSPANSESFGVEPNRPFAAAAGGGFVADTPVTVSGMIMTDPQAVAGDRVESLDRSAGAAAAGKPAERFGDVAKKELASLADDPLPKDGEKPVEAMKELADSDFAVVPDGGSENAASRRGRDQVGAWDVADGRREAGEKRGIEIAAETRTEDQVIRREFTPEPGPQPAAGMGGAPSSEPTPAPLPPIAATATTGVLTPPPPGAPKPAAVSEPMSAAEMPKENSAPIMIGEELEEMEQVQSASRAKDASELDRLAAVDKSMRDLMALTPPVGQAQASSGAGNQPANDSRGNLSKNDEGAVARSPLYRIEAKFAEVGTERGAMAVQPVPAGLDETSANAEPFSTFSLHVSDVSFQLAKAALASGQWPEADKIRIEEFVNAFDYGDPMPGMGERVACRIDQGAHPFLQQRHLVRIALRTAEAGRSAGTPLRLTLLLDSSGSMERPDRRETVRRAVATLAGLLGEHDRVTLVTFARQPRLVADAVPGNEATKLAETVSALPSEGGTNLEAALRLAFEKAREHQEPNAQNRIVLLTDGAANLGDAKAESLAALVEGMRDAGIAFDAAGFGAEGLNDEILEALTRQGDGRYYLLDRPEDAEDAFAKQIAGALRPAAKNVKVQVEFHPDRVKSYKLLGFEKHRLATEDFRNDAVDAAELAAAEAGVAVYQVEPNPAGEGDLGSVSVRFRDLDNGAMVERRWALPYLAAAPAPDQGGDAMLLATVASQFAAKLAGGPIGDVVDLSELARLAAALPDSERVKELRTMIEQARGLEGSRP